jgi:hypothetical protein
MSTEAVYLAPATVARITGGITIFPSCTRLGRRDETPRQS